MIKQLLRAWLRPKSIREGYITIIYPQRGRGVVIHDTLTKGSTYSGSGIAYAEELEELEELEVLKPMFEFNPATGLPMVSDCFDAGGSAFGFGDD